MLNQKVMFPNFHQIKCLIPLVFIGYFGQLMKSRGLQLDKAAKLSTINYSQILFGTIYDYFIYGVHLTGFSILGIILILSSSILLYLKPN